MEKDETYQMFTEGDPAPTPGPQKFEQWAIIELFGHQRIAGLVTEASVGGCSFIRVDVPTADGASIEYTKFYGNGAIYAMSPTTKEAVMISCHGRPSAPVPRQLAKPEPKDQTYVYPDDDDDNVIDDYFNERRNIDDVI